MTPCGAEPAPSAISRMSPVAGSRWPRTPLCCPVYQTPPSAAGATSCGWEPAGTSNSRTSSATGPAAAGDDPVPMLGGGVAGKALELAAGNVDETPVDGTGLPPLGAHEATSKAPTTMAGARGRRPRGGHAPEIPSIRPVCPTADWYALEV